MRGSRRCHSCCLYLRITTWLRTSMPTRSSSRCGRGPHSSSSDHCIPETGKMVHCSGPSEAAHCSASIIPYSCWPLALPQRSCTRIGGLISDPPRPTARLPRVRSSSLRTQYALVKSQRPWWHNTYSALSSGLVGAAGNLPSTLVLLSALGLRRWRELIPRLRRSWMARDNLWLTVLALGPLVLTFLLGFIGCVKVTPNFLIPTVYLLPLIICRALGPMLSAARVRDIMRWAAAFMLFALLITPVIAYTSVAFHFDDKTQISPRVAIAATEAWRGRIASPLGIVTGTEP